MSGARNSSSTFASRSSENSTSIEVSMLFANPSSASVMISLYGIYGLMSYIGVPSSRSAPSTMRPNSLGMSAVKLLEIREDNGQLSLIVEGADLLDGTPIYDIKPYIPYSDIITDADEGFAKSIDTSIDVEFPDDLLAKVDEEFRAPLIRILELDPRDAYDRDSVKPCKMAFANVDIEFVLRDGKLVVTAVNEL